MLHLKLFFSVLMMNVAWMSTALHLLVNAEPSFQMVQFASQTGNVWTTAVVESAVCVSRMAIVMEDNTVPTNIFLPLRMNVLASVIVIVSLAPSVEVTVQLVPGLLHVRKTNIYSEISYIEKWLWNKFLDDIPGCTHVEGPGLFACWNNLLRWQEESIGSSISQLHSITVWNS